MPTETHSNPSAPSGSTSSFSSKQQNKFKLTQLGNAERLIHHHGSNIRYCSGWKSWLVWDGRRWRVDTTGAINRKAHDTVRGMGHEAWNIKQTEARGHLEKHARKSETKSELDAMIGIAQTLKGVSVSPEELDTNPLLLNCKNGIVDLRNGSLIPHFAGKQFLLTKMSPVKYDNNALCPIWLRFLNRIFNCDQSLIAYVQKIIGYAITGNVTEKALFFFHGDGNNGKTTLLEAIRRILGDYAGLVEIDALMQGGQDSARERAIADLHGKRFVTASEAEAGQRFREATLKKLTGMGRLVGRRLYSNSFEFDPTFKLFIDANHKPDIRGTDEAIWLRIRLIPFGVTIPTSEIDKQLWKKLQNEYPGILAWAVQGCQKWQEEGLGTPKAVEVASEAYRKEMDIVQEFIDERCDLDPEATTNPTELYNAFKTWCHSRGEKPPASNVFGEQLQGKGFISERSNSAGRFRRGLRLKPAEEPAPYKEYEEAVT